MREVVEMAVGMLVEDDESVDGREAGEKGVLVED